MSPVDRPGVCGMPAASSERSGILGRLAVASGSHACVSPCGRCRRSARLDRAPLGAKMSGRHCTCQTNLSSYKCPQPEYPQSLLYKSPPAGQSWRAASGDWPCPTCCPVDTRHAPDHSARSYHLRATNDSPSPASRQSEAAADGGEGRGEGERHSIIAIEMFLVIVGKERTNV